jgi:hypothetical protein
MITVHIEHCDGLGGWKQENHADECRPRYSPDVYIPRRPTKIDWPRCEILRPDNLGSVDALVAYLAQDRNTTTPVHGDCRDLTVKTIRSRGYIENGRDGGE